MDNKLTVLPNSAAAILDHILPVSQRILFFGPPGSGKTTLSKALASQIGNTQRHCHGICADPGSPGFGQPGSVTLAEWHQNHWQLIASEALCSLDAGRFRLPLISAVRHLARISIDALLLVDGPGVVRGVAGRELLTGLIDAADIDTVLILTSKRQPIPLENELNSLGINLYMVRPDNAAVRPGKRSRARYRTQLWDSYLESGEVVQTELNAFNLLGTPPPLEESMAWVGRQVALLKGQRTLAMGEIQQLNRNILTLKLSGKLAEANNLLIRDARRNEQGMLETAESFAAARFEFIPPSTSQSDIEESGGPRVVGRVGSLDVTLLNGVFGDPLLHLRIRHKGRSLLFDLGEGGRLSARLAHQVTDVFISHAHMDHIGGFQWLLRSRLGEFPPCRLYGPPGLARHIAGFIQGFLWDRIDNRGPSFEINELHGNIVKRFQIQAGYAEINKLEEVRITDGILLREPGFQIRAVQLDHQTPVLAYAFEPDMEIHVRKDRLAARGLEPGPWLTSLKQALLADQPSTLIELPDSTREKAGILAQDLTLISPGKKLVYATDLADTKSNREILIGFAKYAHTFFCEATFLESDIKHAIRNGHLTTRACGEIATAARVGRLVSFHFSRRYAQYPDEIYAELKAACDRVIMPQTMDIFDRQTTRDSELTNHADIKI